MGEDRKSRGYASTVLLRNIGHCVSGDVRRPLLDADSLFIRDGRIEAAGRGLGHDADVVIDVRGATVAPGLIDGHTHPVFGEFTPPQQGVHWIRPYLHGGVVAVISAGELHLPGLPLQALTPQIVKSLALLAKVTYDHERPAGVKVYAGTVLLVPGLTPADFDEFAAAGIKLVKFIFYDWAKAPRGEAQQYVAWAHARGIKVKLHSGGVSRSGVSRVAGWDVVHTLRPDIVGHINGGPIPMPEGEMLRIVHETDLGLEFCTSGNPRLGVRLFQAAREANAKHRVVIGTDTPGGTGIAPRAMLRNVLLGASLADLDPAEVLCMASGNVAEAHGIEGGFLRAGSPADLVVLDAIEGSVGRDALSAIKNGDLPGVGVVMIDGKVLVSPRSDQTPPPRRAPVISHNRATESL
jgi:enamidase